MMANETVGLAAIASDKTWSSGREVSPMLVSRIREGFAFMFQSSRWVASHRARSLAERRPERT
jgi:hypothetical protein